MIRSRGPLLIVLSLIFAVSAAWIANHWVQARTAVAETAPTAPVVIAVMDIPFGTTMQPRHLTTIQMLRGTEPSGSFSTIEEVEGKVARAALLAGEILLAGRFVDQGSGSTLA